MSDPNEKHEQKLVILRERVRDLSADLTEARAHIAGLERTVQHLTNKVNEFQNFDPTVVTQLHEFGDATGVSPLFNPEIESEKTKEFVCTIMNAQQRLIANMRRGFENIVMKINSRYSRRSGGSPEATSSHVIAYIENIRMIFIRTIPFLMCDTEHSKGEHAKDEHCERSRLVKAILEIVNA